MKKNLLKLFSLLAISCCFMLPACSSSDTSTTSENKNAETTAATDTTFSNPEDVLDIETETSDDSNEENSGTIKSLLSSILSLFTDSNNSSNITDLLSLGSSNNNESDDKFTQYINELKELLDNHFDEVNNESLNSILEKLKDGEASEEDLTEIKNYLKNNGIDFTSLKLTNSEKEKISQYVIDNKDNINNKLKQYKLDNLDYNFMLDLMDKLLNNN